MGNAAQIRGQDLKPGAGRQSVIRRRQLLLAANLIALGVLGFMLRPGWSLPHTTSARQAVAMIAERHEHGLGDENQPYMELSRIASTRPISVTCGVVSTWAVQLLREAGYEARVVTTMTLDHWNGDDNGHTLVSVLEPSGWVVYDIDRDVYYTDADGTALNLRDLLPRVRTGDYVIVPLDDDPVDEGFIRESNRRLMQIGGIHDSDRYVFGIDDPMVALRVASYAYDYATLPIPAWEALYFR